MIHLEIGCPEGNKVYPRKEPPLISHPLSEQERSTWGPPLGCYQARGSSFHFSINFMPRRLGISRRPKTAQGFEPLRQCAAGLGLGVTHTHASPPQQQRPAHPMSRASNHRPCSRVPCSRRRQADARRLLLLSRHGPFSGARVAQRVISQHTDFDCSFPDVTQCPATMSRPKGPIRPRLEAVRIRTRAGTLEATRHGEGGTRLHLMWTRKRPRAASCPTALSAISRTKLTRV